MTFDYNTTRKKLILAEYGRNVQNMVAYICTLPTKEERNRYAQVVIDMMGFLNPHLRDVADFKHKLWDHLHIISDFKIDVDSPYPIPTQEAIHKKPDALSYPQNRIKYKHYGKAVEKLIEKARALEDPDQKKLMSESIANFMKLAYVNWNKDFVEDETILNDLKQMSEGELTLDENINLAKLEYKATGLPARPKPAVQKYNNNNKNRQNNRSPQGQNQGNRQKNTGRRF